MVGDESDDDEVASATLLRLQLAADTAAAHVLDVAEQHQAMLEEVDQSLPPT